MRRADRESRTQVSIIDISRAYFNVKKSEDDDPTYVDLPEEDAGKATGMCGLLVSPIAGTPSLSSSRPGVNPQGTPHSIKLLQYCI